MDIAKRNGALDFIKVVATTIIVLHHYQQLAGVFYETGINFYFGTFYFGYIVEMFFIMSGFCMLKYIERIEKGVSFWQYYFNRWYRFLPGITLSVAAYCLLAICYGILYGEAWCEYAISVWGGGITLLGIQTWGIFLDPGYNGVLWYISCLLLCYIFFYITSKICITAKISCCYGYLLMIFLGCIMMESTKSSISLPFWNHNIGRAYVAFFVGILFAVLYESGKYVRYYKYAWVVIFFAGFDVLVLHDGLPYMLTFMLYPAIMIVLMQKPFQQLLSNKSIFFLGKASYWVYLLHVPCIIGMYIMQRWLKISFDFADRTTSIWFTLTAWSVGIAVYWLADVIRNRYFPMIKNQDKKI